VTCPSTNPSVTHVFHQYVLRYADRDVLRFYLEGSGINTLVHYPVPIHQQPAYQGRLFIGEAGLPHTELAAQEILSLPMYPELTEEDVNRVGTGIRHFFR